MAMSLQRGALAFGFDFDLICSNALFLDSNQIIEGNPGLLLELSQYSLADLREQVSPFFSEADKPRIIRVIESLYVKSLRNSRYGEAVGILEAQLPRYIEMVRTSAIKALIREARGLVSSPLPGGRRDQIDKELAQLRATAQKVEAVVALYAYSEQRTREAVYLLVRNEVNEELVSFFPQCARWFRPFAQSLDRQTSAKENLVRQRGRLMERIRQMEEQRAPLMRGEERATPTQKRICEFYAIPLWSAGIRLLERALRLTFEKEWEEGVEFFSDFRAAVDRAANETGNLHLLSEELLNNIPPNLPETYIYHVWSHILGDVADLMELVIKKLPEAQCVQLELDLRASQDRRETILTALIPFLESQMEEGVTCPALRVWVME